MPDLNPVCLDLTGRAVLVVGGGPIAFRKVIRLLGKGAKVTVVAPELSEDLRNLPHNDQLIIHERLYNPQDLDNCWLVFACTDNEKINQAVSSDTVQARIWCNVVDQPDLCTFQTPSVLKQGLLQLAISTAGASPGFALKLRKHLEKQFGPVYDDLLKILLEIREGLKKKYPGDQPRRQEILNTLLDSPALNDFLKNEDSETFIAELEQWKSQSLE